CGTRIQSLVSGAGSSFGLECKGAPEGSGSCKLTIEGVPFTLPLTCSPNECRTVSAAAEVAAAMSSGAPPPPPPVQDWVPLVASIPLAVVVMLAVAMMAGLMSYRRHFAAVWCRYDMYKDGNDEDADESGRPREGGERLNSSAKAVEAAASPAATTSTGTASTALPNISGIVSDAGVGVDVAGGRVANLLGALTNGTVYDGTTIDVGDSSGKPTALIFENITVDVPYNRLFGAKRSLNHHYLYDDQALIKGHPSAMEE
ncbi:hypothetical protein Vretimale_16537, partial [Volvox reticuliferus]